jgi:hypothetical protein
MSRINRSSLVIAALGAVTLLAGCSPGDRDGPDTTATGQGSSDVRYPLAVASIPVLRVAADAERRRDCLTRTFSYGRSVRLPAGEDIRILAHDSTVAYEFATLEEGEHYISIMVDNGATGLAEYALAPGDTTCWAVRADSIGVHSVFYGRDATVLRPLTIDVHSEKHARADADWLVERRYPAQFRRFESALAATTESSWVPPFLAPTVAFASTVAMVDTTDQGGSGPWTVCAAYGCCKPR